MSYLHTYLGQQVFKSAILTADHFFCVLFFSRYLYSVKFGNIKYFQYIV